MRLTHCLQCGEELDTDPRFCSRECAEQYNDEGPDHDRDRED